MRVFLLSPYPEYMKDVSTTQYPPLGILYIGGAICHMVTELTILDANVLKLSRRETLKRICDFHPDIVGISINIVTAEAARQIALEIKKVMPVILLVAGGPLPTANSREWLSLFDVVLAGEGEETFQNLIMQYQDKGCITEDIPGICIKEGSFSIAEHPDLDRLPFPAYDYLVPSLPYYSKRARIIKKNMAPILTSRGCPYSCTFCDKIIHGTNFRPRSSDSVLKEVQWLYNNYHVRQLDIIDDNFTFQIDRASEILDGIMDIGSFSINCQNGIRADKVTEELISKMKKAGVFRVGIGIESGKQENVKRLNKHLDLEDVGRAISMFRKQKITVHGYFILGFPFETEEDIFATVRFAKKVNPHFSNFSHFIPIIGTPIYNELVENNKIIGEKGEIKNGFYNSDQLFKASELTAEEMRRIYKKAWRLFYLRPYKIWDILLSIKSYKEFIWVIKIGVNLIKDYFIK